MERIERLLRRAASARKAAKVMPTGAKGDHLILEAERFEDQAWSLNEADASLPALISGLWSRSPRLMTHAA